jgi:hypothetical protein
VNASVASLWGASAPRFFASAPDGHIPQSRIRPFCATAVQISKTAWDLSTIIAYSYCRFRRCSQARQNRLKKTIVACGGQLTRWRICTRVES